MSAKLHLIILGACLAVILATGSALIVAQWILAKERMLTELQTRAKILSANAVAAVAFRSVEDAEDILRSIAADPDNNAAVIFEPSGREFARFVHPRSGAVIAPPAGPGAIEHRFTSRDLTVWLPMQSADGRPMGTLALQRALTPLYATIVLFAGITMAVMMCASLLALVLSHLLQRLVADPVLALARAANQVTATQDFSARVPEDSPDELGQLARAFNLMFSAVQAGQLQAAELNEKLRAHAAELEHRVEQRTAELRRAYAELETFSYSVSHDLRSPLRSIGSFTELLIQDAGAKLGPEATDYSRRILAAVARMNRLIEGLLEFSRAGKRELRIEPLDLASLARSVVADLTTDPRLKKAEVLVEALSPCAGDATLVREVLMNLLGNALKYSRDRDPAIVSLSETGPPGDAMATYVVKDNGAGFDMKHASRLFRVFERLHDGRRFEGTGIGLATSKRIIERHGGTIWAEAAPDQGAQFFFTLPRSAAAAAAVPRMDIGATPPPSGRAVEMLRAAETPGPMAG